MQDCSANNQYLQHHFLIDQCLVFKQCGLCKFKIFIMKSLMDNAVTLLSSPLLITLTKLSMEQHINCAVHTDSSSLSCLRQCGSIQTPCEQGYIFLLPDVCGFAFGSSGCVVPTGTRQWSCPCQRPTITAHHGIPEVSAYLHSLIPWKTWPSLPSPPISLFLKSFFLVWFVLLLALFVF